ncbi:hypothetical protein G9P44_002851 [Scheffersomyces stipitis]|nr:hypothetical protein G9P44_002851 [Scheffersomyces stipitis]
MSEKEENGCNITVKQIEANSKPSTELSSSSRTSSALEINFRPAVDIVGSTVDYVPSNSIQYNFDYSSSQSSKNLLPSISTCSSGAHLYDSKKCHTNFWKNDDRIVQSSSDFSIANKASDSSRYFLRNSTHLSEMENPSYYFHSVSNSIATNWTTSNTSQSISSSKVAQQTLFPTTSSELTSNSSIIGITEKSDIQSLSNPIAYIDLKESILTDEELKNIDDQFPTPPKVFNNFSDYFNPVVYYRNFNLGQFLAVIALISIIVFGSIGYVIMTARSYYKPLEPEVYEVLSYYKYPTLSAIRTSLIDLDTPKEAHTKNSFHDNEPWKLVFSDEFNVEGRTFHEGDDQFFTAVDLHYAATNDLEYYTPHMAETINGSLRITIDAYQTNGLDYISAMLQSWNKLCFNKNAMVEVSLRMPSYSQSKGLWPAVWSLGNLARPGYMATTDGVWPYTYDECDYGITPNQSSPDGISYLPGQRLSKCTCLGQDHPNLGVGRGAPEIDIIEGTHAGYDDWALGAQTLQVAPFDPWWRPDYDFLTIENYNHTSMKADTGTPQQESIASTTVLNSEWFESLRNRSNYSQSLQNHTHFQTYGFEYRSEKTEERDSYIQFFVADEKTFGVYGDSLHPAGNVGWRQITKEPMSLIFNLGLSPTWQTIDFASLDYPATLEIDYIRIYQREGEEEMTCDPPDYPTVDYINSHIAAYSNVNFTSWEQAGYKTPRNSFMHGCLAPIQ